MRRKESKKAHNKRKNKDQQSNGKCSEYVECRAHTHDLDPLVIYWIDCDWPHIASAKSMEHSLSPLRDVRSCACACSKTIEIPVIPFLWYPFQLYESNEHFEQFYLYNGKITKKSSMVVYKRGSKKNGIANIVWSQLNNFKWKSNTHSNIQHWKINKPITHCEDRYKIATKNPTKYCKKNMQK